MRRDTACDTRIGRYRLLGLLASGGMAEVYLALAGELSGFRTLAVVKRILPHYSANTDFIKMFFDEARIVALLDHPNIVRILEVGHDGDEHFLAMELVQGKPLSALLRKAFKLNSPLTLPQAAHMVAQAANGLAHAHDLVDGQGRPLNVVHRDVSPQNILVSYEGVVKVIDFGVARALGRVSETQPGGLKGKIQYMSPEQAAGGTVDHRSDIFALGVILWEAICGRRPFRRETDLDTLRAIVEEPIPAPSRFVQIPARLESIVMKSLQKDPAARYQRAHEMALALERFAFSNVGFDPAQVTKGMKSLFASDFTRWKKTVATARECEGEPEEWIHTNGTYLRPGTVSLKPRDVAPALRAVRTPRPALTSSQELNTESRTLPSLALYLDPTPRRRRRRRALVAGVGAMTALMGLWTIVWSRAAAPDHSPVRAATVDDGASSPRQTAGVRVEVLPPPPVPQLPVQAPEPAAIATTPPALATNRDAKAAATEATSHAPPTATAFKQDASISDPFVSSWFVQAAEKHASAKQPTSLVHPATTGAGKRATSARHEASRASLSPVKTAATAALPPPMRVSDWNSMGAMAKVCSLLLGTRPWSEVWIDGQNTNRHTPYADRVACGKHTFTFKRPDLGLTRTMTLTLTPGATVQQSVALQDR